MCGRARRRRGQLAISPQSAPTSRPICDTGIPWIMDDDELFRAEISRHHGPLIRRRGACWFRPRPAKITVIAYPVSDARSPPRLGGCSLNSTCRFDPSKINWMQNFAGFCSANPLTASWPRPTCFYVALAATYIRLLHGKIGIFFGGGGGFRP